MNNIARPMWTSRPANEGGFNVGWVAAGEWLKYTVNVSQAGAYTLEFRVTAERTGGTFHLEVNGVDRTGPIQVPATGGWQNWATVTKSGVSLSAGSQVWRLVFDSASNGIVGNFNSIRVTGSAASGASTPYTGTACWASRYRAERELRQWRRRRCVSRPLRRKRGRASTALQEWTSSRPPIVGAATASAMRSRGNRLAYTVNVASAGTYDIEVRVASSGAGGTFHIDVNGVNKTGTFTVPNTGGWQTWVTLRKTGLTLSGGQQVFKLVLDSSGPGGAVGNFNYLRVAASSSGIRRFGWFERV